MDIGNWRVIYITIYPGTWLQGLRTPTSPPWAYHLFPAPLRTLQGRSWRHLDLIASREPLLAPIRCHLGALWEHFGLLFLAFSGSVQFCWIALPLERKPIFCGLGSVLWTPVCLLLTMSVLRTDFSGFLSESLDFWGLPRHPFGVLWQGLRYFLVT